MGGREGERERGEGELETCSQNFSLGAEKKNHHKGSISFSFPVCAFFIFLITHEVTELCLFQYAKSKFSFQTWCGEFLIKSAQALRINN